MTEKTIELGVISIPEGEQLGGHGTGLKGCPSFRKLTEQEVAESVTASFLARMLRADVFIPATCNCNDSRLPAFSSLDSSPCSRLQSCLASFSSLI